MKQSGIVQIIHSFNISLLSPCFALYFSLKLTLYRYISLYFYIFFLHFFLSHFLSLSLSFFFLHSLYFFHISLSFFIFSSLSYILLFAVISLPELCLFHPRRHGGSSSCWSPPASPPPPGRTPPQTKISNYYLEKVNTNKTRKFFRLEIVTGQFVYTNQII